MYVWHGTTSLHHDHTLEPPNSTAPWHGTAAWPRTLAKQAPRETSHNCLAEESSLISDNDGALQQQTHYVGHMHTSRRTT